MNVRIVAIAAVVCAAAATLGAAPGRTGSAASAPSRVLVGGPLLAGSRVVWLEADGNEMLLESAVPGRSPRILLRQKLRNAWLDDLAASHSAIALERQTQVCPPPTPPTASSCTEQREVLGAALPGRFGLLAASDDCGGGFISLSPSTDASGAVVAMGENVCLSPLDRRRRVVIARPGKPGLTTLCDADQFAVPPHCYGDVRIAGRFVAWRDRRDAIVVSDRIRRTMVDRRLFPFIASFDVQADGKLVVAYQPRGADKPASVAWRALGSPGRDLPFDVRIPDLRHAVVRIDGDRILAERATPGRSSSTLVLSDLQGRTREIARFAAPIRRAGDFDLAGSRLTWASTRVTRTRVDCPPPGIMRPCVVRRTGVTTIWLAPAAGGKPAIVARLPFADEPG
jgi:hypothetical protein